MPNLGASLKPLLSFKRCSNGICFRSVTVPVVSKPRTPRELLWTLTTILLMLVFLLRGCKIEMAVDLLNLLWVDKEVKRNGLLIVIYIGRCISCECAYVHAHAYTCAHKHQGLYSPLSVSIIYKPYNLDKKI